MKKLSIILLSGLSIFSACKSSKNAVGDNLPTVDLDTITVSATPKPKVYHASRTRYFDLLNTKLDVRFNWEKQYLYGKATIRLTPLFYPQDSLTLNAKGFDINKISLLNGPDLKYSYDSLQLHIKLDKTYTRKDTLEVYIDYTAKPEERITGGSMAISSDKGLFFINPLGKDPDKPKEIWTQGETEANSAWFPTFDSPNERCTDEINMTVDTSYVTLSNGLLTYSEVNGDGTRTDHWKMDMPHAPYLFMMAVGKFSVIHDKWTRKDKTIDVDYFIEPKYAKYARHIFGNTPEMLSFYSKTLGVDYPWPKFDQIIVRDYVSGAMENTTAVLHGEFLQQTDRERLDGDNEDVIAHELFHHWFGDYVTCESWANLPLNESFATYGEYLWIDHKYGRDEADYHIQQQLDQYMQEAKTKQVNMIRYDYSDREDMFDGHTYQKGGRILHMLRNYVGDKAFFKSLQTYLQTNKLSAVEMDNLRLAFEKVTGEDLNWFFNEWFFASGHPVLDINYAYNDSLHKAYVYVDQKQNFETTPLYKLPIAIDIYSNGKKERHKVTIRKAHEVFEFDAPVKPDLINFDGDKMLSCDKSDNHTSESEWAYMYEHAPLYMDRYEAVEALSTYDDSLAYEIMLKALNDKFWNIRKEAIQKIRYTAHARKDEVKTKLLGLAKNDEKTKVRGKAIEALSIYFDDDEDVKNMIAEQANDSSYYVISSSMVAMRELDSKRAYKLAEHYENEDNAAITIAVSEIYADEAGPEKNQYFLDQINGKLSDYYKYSFVRNYGKYLKRMKPEVVEKALPTLKDEALNNDKWWLRLSYIQALDKLQDQYENDLKVTKKELKETDADMPKAQELNNTVQADSKLLDKLNAIMDELRAKETNETLKKYLGVK